MTHRQLSFLPVLAGFVCIALASRQAAAQITYVDAAEGSSGNTYATGGSLDDTSWLNPVNSLEAIEDQWRKRVFANNDTVMQARHGLNPDDMPELTTEITGLTDGRYEVWVFFWDATGANVWNISAGLTSGELSTFSFDGLGDIASPIAANSLSFTNNPVTIEDNRLLYGVNLGTADVVGGSPIPVFIDNLTGGGSNNRTWYDGVGYAPISVLEENPLQISSLTSLGGGIWEVTFTGESSAPYQLISSTNLEFTSNPPLENLTQGEVGTVSGTNDNTITTDPSGNAIVRVDLGNAPVNFFRLQTLPNQEPQ